MVKEVNRLKNELQKHCNDIITLDEYFRISGDEIDENSGLLLDRPEILITTLSVRQIIDMVHPHVKIAIKNVDSEELYTGKALFLPEELEDYRVFNLWLIGKGQTETEKFGSLTIMVMDK